MQTKSWMLVLTASHADFCEPPVLCDMRALFANGDRAFTRAGLERSRGPATLDVVRLEDASTVYRKKKSHHYKVREPANLKPGFLWRAAIVVYEVRAELAVYGSFIGVLGWVAWNKAGTIDWRATFQDTFAYAMIKRVAYEY